LSPQILRQIPKWAPLFMKTATAKLSRVSLVAIICVTAIPAHADQSITYTVKTVF
jgi:hypothetical protein